MPTPEEHFPEEIPDRLQPRKFTGDDAIEAVRRDLADLPARIEFEGRLKPKWEQDRERLQARQDKGELSKTVFGLADVQRINIDEGRPIVREDLGNRALVLTKGDMQSLMRLEVVIEGIGYETIDVGDMNDPGLILFPEEVGEVW